MRVSVYLTTIGLFTLSLGCGTKASKKGEIAIIPPYDGIWFEGCTLDETAENYSNAQLTITGKTSVGVMNVYSEDDSSCSQPVYTITTRNDFILGNDVAKVSGAKELNQSATSVSMIVFDDMTASQLNLIEYCGVKSWKKGVSQDLEKAGCSAFFDPSYDIIKVDGNKLFFGLTTEELSGSAPSTRPNELETTYMTKQ